MNITKRLFTYPVLNEDNNDYTDSVFDVHCSLKRDGAENLSFTFDIDLQCPELQALINDNKAEYAMHLEAQSTAFRTVVRGVSNSLQHSVATNKLRNSIELVALLVLKEDYNGLKLNSWNEDFDGDSFDLPKGTVLAYKNLPDFKITKNFEELQNVKSIFKICKRTNDDNKPFEINLDSDFIKLTVSASEYLHYSSLTSRYGWNVLLNNILILPSLVYVFEQLKYDDGIERYEHCNWFQALKASYQKRGIDFEDELRNGTGTTLAMAQEAMELPFLKSLDQILLLASSDDNGDDQQ